MIRYFISISAVVFVMLFAMACSPFPEKKRVEMHCHSELSGNERIACYKQMIQEKILQRISIGTRQLSPSDWPFDYIIRIDVQLDTDGNILSLDLLRETNSRQLNTSIMRSIKSIKQFVVPMNELFQEGGFSRLKLLIKPGRTPILGAEKKLESDLMIIYLPGACETRSQQC